MSGLLPVDARSGGFGSFHRGKHFCENRFRAPGEVVLEMQTRKFDHPNRGPIREARVTLLHRGVARR